MLALQADSPTTPRMDPAAAGRSRALGGPGRVLVVDDELALGRAYARLLGHEGYEVATATDGLNACEMIEGGSFDLVISDIWMPGLDGLGLLRAVRCIDADVPVVLTTSAPTGEGMSEAAEAGALLYLIKPIDTRALLHVVDYGVRLCREARRRAEERAETGAATGEDQREISACLDRALGSLAMAFQPIVLPHRREVFGYEALLRSREPTLSGPKALLGAAAQLGRLRDVGRAVRAAVAAEAQGAPPSASIFVNVHPTDLQDESLYAPSAPLSRIARRVVLEITERAPLEKVDDLEGRIAALRALGYRIAVDDLGAGYAGLTAMVQLKPEVIKLDMSLVRDIDKDPMKQKVVGAMVSLSRSMGVRVLAEGVETPEERDALGRLECELMQGYHFGRPAQGFLPPAW